MHALLFEQIETAILNRCIRIGHCQVSERRNGRVRWQLSKNIEAPLTDSSRLLRVAQNLGECRCSGWIVERVQAPVGGIRPPGGPAEAQRREAEQHRQAHEEPRPDPAPEPLRRPGRAHHAALLRSRSARCSSNIPTATASRCS